MRRHSAVRMLLYDRSTTAGAVLGVVAIVFLVGQQLAVMFGLFTLMSALVDNSGADIWILSQNSDNTSTAHDLPSRYVDRLAGLGDIEWAEPVIYSAARLEYRAASRRRSRSSAWSGPGWQAGRGRWPRAAATCCLNSTA